MASFTESFNTGDSTTLGPDQTWTEVSGDWSISSNRAGIVSPTGLPIAVCDFALDSDEHYVEVVFETFASNGGVIIRWASANNHYLVRYDSGWQIYRNNSGYSLIASGAGSGGVASGDTLRVEIDGTDKITIKVNGSEVFSHTDGSPVGGGLKVGLTMGASQSWFDSAAGGDLAAPPGGLSIPVAMYNYRRQRAT